MPATTQERAFLFNRQIDAIRGTIFRQTMFAEFEKLAHASVEAGEPLTLDRFKEIYHGLLTAYFGPDFALDEELDLECLRIPHFYRAFYVYKYATGMSAAIALADRVTGGGPAELDDYLDFLKGGCSKDPLDLLRDAGATWSSPIACGGPSTASPGGPGVGRADMTTDTLAAALCAARNGGCPSSRSPSSKLLSAVVGLERQDQSHAPRGLLEVRRPRSGR